MVPDSQEDVQLNDISSTAERIDDVEERDLANEDELLEQAQQVSCFGWRVNWCYLQQAIGAAILIVGILLVLGFLISQLWR